MYVGRAYMRLPLRGHLLNRVLALEGGTMFSLTLRKVLDDHFGVLAGDFSYGSLLYPGMADAGTAIGRYVSIGPNVRRFGANHPLDRYSLHPLYYNANLGLVDAGADVDRRSCTIESESWIGANTTITPGVTRIGLGAVVGAGSVVTHDVPDFAVFAGNPAVLIRYRFDSTEQERMRQAAPWLLEPVDAASVYGRLASERPQ